MGGVVEVIVFLSIIIEWKEIRSVGGKNQLFADLFFWVGWMAIEFNTFIAVCVPCISWLQLTLLFDSLVHNLFFCIIVCYISSILRSHGLIATIMLTTP
jgi:hypothetical protein